MKVHVATAGDAPWHDDSRRIFAALAEADVVGHHSLVADAAEADAILFVDLHQHPRDPMLRALRRHPLVRRHRDKVCVYDERDYPWYTFPGIYVGGTPGMARAHAVVGGPYAKLPTPVAPCHEPDLLFSFRGGRTHPVREAVLGLRHPRAVVEDTSGLGFLPGRERNQATEHAQQAFNSLIRRSKFTLCPRGHGPSSIRLYETLCAGGVPVVISDDWLAPPGVDWGACTIRVAEDRIRHIPALLEEHEPRWPALREQTRAVVAEAVGPDRLWDHFCGSLEIVRDSPQRSRGPWWLQPRFLRVGARVVRERLG